MRVQEGGSAFSVGHLCTMSKEKVEIPGSPTSKCILYWKRKVKSEYMRLRQLKRLQANIGAKNLFVSNFTKIQEKINILNDDWKKLRVQPIQSMKLVGGNPFLKQVLQHIMYYISFPKFIFTLPHYNIPILHVIVKFRIYPERKFRSVM
uniref:Uncharacterized protein n=1 Tax=Naja naja TaxID=35670 RepID=A0A8C7DXQ8_NAJNA